MNKRRQPILFSFCSPAGGGKSTLCRKLVQSDETLIQSCSTTTRAPRSKEIDGKDYYFVSEDEFERRVQAGLFIEHARFGGSRYGTELRNLERAKEQGADLLLAIDVQGADALKQKFPRDALIVCVFPPSLEVLQQRLRGRGTESEARFAERLRIAQGELATMRKPGFSDYLLINGDLVQAVRDAQSIISAERQRFDRFSPEYLGDLFRS